jgi:NADH-quinone oxidoreductase subunit G
MGSQGTIDPAPFQAPEVNFFMTDPISRASVTMSRCATAAGAADERKTGTDG